MVQGGLLTSHPGSIHGDGEAPGGGSSLRQSAENGSTDSPDLETEAAAEQRRDREKGSAPRVFGARGKYRRRVAARGHQGVQAPPGRGPTLVRATRALGPWWHLSGPHLIIPKASGALIF